jgi:hypothetical protein
MLLLSWTPKPELLLLLLLLYELGRLPAAALFALVGLALQAAVLLNKVLLALLLLLMPDGADLAAAAGGVQLYGLLLLFVAVFAAAEAMAAASGDFGVPELLRGLHRKRVACKQVKHLGSDSADGSSMH